MASRIEHSARYSKPVAIVHGAFTQERYWRERLAEIGGPRATLEDVQAGEGTIDLHMTQAIHAEHLPSVVTTFRPGDLVIHRHESWGPLLGEEASGRFTASVDGVPAKLHGTLTLQPDADGSMVHLNGEVGVHIPFFGGKIEAVIVDQVVELLEAEQRFTAGWISSGE